MSKSTKNLKLVYWLLAFGILISGPRFSGAFASALGIDLFKFNPIWAWIEIMSGWALAVFEALAIAYIASRFRQIQVLDDDESLPLKDRIKPVNAVYWVILLMGQAFLLFTIPMVSTVHLATQTFRESNGDAVKVYEILTWRHLATHHLTWLWLFTTAAASTLFVFLIGLVMDDFGVIAKASTTKLLDTYLNLKENMPIVDPQTLAANADITVKEAADFLDGLNPAVPSQKYATRLHDIKQRMTNGK